MRVLITGINGFVGSHFAEYALSRDAEVYGSWWGSDLENVEHFASRITLTRCDVRDTAAVQRLVDAARPDFVVHLAAQSSVGASWQAPVETFVTNGVGQVNVLEAIRPQPVPPRTLVVGSSDEYGCVTEDELPVLETAPLRPLSPYAVSKVAQDLLGYQYFKSYGLPIVRARAFNHEGPRRSDAFLTSSVARQIAEIEIGARTPVLRVGNLEARRDYTDVRDVVRGYWLLLERGEPGEVYNLCSGRAWTVQALVDFLIGQALASPIDIHRDPERLRPSDVPVLIGDGNKIRKAVGWRPQIPLEQTLLDILGYWRRRVAGSREPREPLAGPTQKEA
jgi:GDP-4-dehydro-6-deoxy-D-mannose reductase